MLNRTGVKSLTRILTISILPLILFFTGCGRSGSGAAFDPAKIKSVVLYDIDPKEGENYSEQLAKVSSYALKPEQIASLFAEKREESLKTWQGAFLGVVQFHDGKESHLAFSIFGGFARVLATGQQIRFYEGSRIEYEQITKHVMRNVFTSRMPASNPTKRK